METYVCQFGKSIQWLWSGDTRRRSAWGPYGTLEDCFCHACANHKSTIFLVFLAALFPIILNTVTAVEQVPERLLEAASMLGTSRSKALWKIVFPAALPGIIGGLRVAVGLAWALLVVGEMTGITVGLGAMITEAKEVSKTDLIVAGMFIIGILGFLSDRLIVWVVKLLAHGRPVLPNTK